MTYKSFFLHVLICSIGCACSPRINTNIVKKYPPQTLSTPVTVYTREQDVPANSELIGTIGIYDAGASLNCDSVTVISIAKNETQKAGGNGLLITRHLKPSFWASSCHQIWGNMLLVSDFPRTADTAVRSTPETITFVHTQGSIQQQKQIPKMAFMLNAGYSWRTAKIYDDLSDFEKHLIKQVKSGFLWSGSASYYFKYYYGIGLCFSQFATSYQTFVQDLNTGRNGEFKIADRITYFGPAFTMQAPLGKSAWLFDIGFSAGYIEYKSKQNFLNETFTISGNSVGFQTEAGLSYKISPEFAIGFKIRTTDGTLFQLTTVDNYGQKTTEKLDSKNGESLTQFGLSLGIRYYIK